jgi:hypothetical protein
MASSFTIYSKYRIYRKIKRYLWQAFLLFIRKIKFIAGPFSLEDLEGYGAARPTKISPKIIFTCSSIFTILNHFLLVEERTHMHYTMYLGRDHRHSASSHTFRSAQPGFEPTPPVGERPRGMRPMS